MFTVTLTGGLAVALVGHLMVESQWFEVQPLPDMLWEITIKIENGERVMEWLQLQKVVY